MKNFMDKDLRVSIETISSQFDVSVGTLHTIIREELKMRKICAKFVPRVFKEDQKERRSYDSREMVELINSDPAFLDASGGPAMKAGSTALNQRPRDRVPSMHALIDPKEGQTEQIHTQTFVDPFFFYSTGMIYMHWVPTRQIVNKEYYTEFF